jgi:hypothetical protein
MLPSKQFPGSGAKKPEAVVRWEPQHGSAMFPQDLQTLVGSLQMLWLTRQAFPVVQQGCPIPPQGWHCEPVSLVPFGQLVVHLLLLPHPW